MLLTQQSAVQRRFLLMRAYLCMRSGLELGMVATAPLLRETTCTIWGEIYESYVCIAGHNECVANFDPLRSGLSEPFIK